MSERYLSREMGKEDCSLESISALKSNAGGFYADFLFRNDKNKLHDVTSRSPHDTAFCFLDVQ